MAIFIKLRKTSEIRLVLFTSTGEDLAAVRLEPRWQDLKKYTIGEDCDLCNKDGALLVPIGEQASGHIDQQSEEHYLDVQVKRLRELKTQISAIKDPFSRKSLYYEEELNILKGQIIALCCILHKPESDYLE